MTARLHWRVPVRYIVWKDTHFAHKMTSHLRTSRPKTRSLPGVSLVRQYLQYPDIGCRVSVSEHLRRRVYACHTDRISISAHKVLSSCLLAQEITLVHTKSPGLSLLGLVCLNMTL